MSFYQDTIETIKTMTVKTMTLKEVRAVVGTMYKLHVHEGGQIYVINLDDLAFDAFEALPSHLQIKE